MKRFAILLAAAAILAGCAHEPVPLGGAGDITVLDANEMPQPLNGAGASGSVTYTIGAYDKLIIDVFGVAEMRREIQVDGSGDITFPFIGRLTALGRTPSQLASEIAAGLRGHYIRDPQVSVNLEELVSQQVTVDGEVKEPGNYPALGNMTLMRAIARAGGTAEFAKLEDVVVLRNVGEQKYIALYNLGAIRRGAYNDPRIYSGDVVVVGDSPGRRRMRDIVGISSLLATPLVALINQI